MSPIPFFFFVSCNRAAGGVQWDPKTFSINDEERKLFGELCRAEARMPAGAAATHVECVLFLGRSRPLDADAEAKRAQAQGVLTKLLEDHALV